MMKLKLMACCAVLVMMLFSLDSLAQNGAISGTVRNNLNDVLAGATVRLVSLPDSALVATKVSDDEGRFGFSQLRFAPYFLVITATGHQRYFSMPFNIDTAHDNLIIPVIAMSSSKAAALAEVVVISRRPLLVQEIDRTVVNVDAMISSATSNTYEVLEKTPGISIGANGDISLNGRAGVLVLIDGRPTYMSGQDLAAYLKSLPGGLIDKLELMDNPPARYDAAGSSVINIRLKRRRTAGFTGSINAGYSQGRFGRVNNGINFNYNAKKVNVFANLGFNQEKNYNKNVSRRTFYNVNGQTISNISLNTREKVKTTNFNLNSGIDYSPGKMTTIGMLVNINTGDVAAVLNHSNRNYNAMYELDSSGTVENIGSGSRKNTGINFNLLHKFNDRGAELTGDINYNRYHQSREHNLDNLFFNKNGNFIRSDGLFYDLPSDISIYTAKADIVLPLARDARLDAGYKSSFVKSEHVSDNFLVSGDVFLKDNARSNHFIYKETIHAAYVTLQKRWKRFGLQAGLRAENTNSKGNQLGNSAVAGSRFNRNYTGLFPVGFLSYKLDTLNRNSLNLSFSRRISRPSYQNLNPFIFFRDQYSYTTGNPMLSPQYQSRIELKFQHKQFLNMGLSYNRFTRVIFQATQAVENVLITKPDNIGSGYMILLNTNVSFDVTRWWYTNTTLRLSRIGLNGQVYNQKLNPRANIARLEVMNMFTLSKTWKAELGGYYASADMNGQSKTKGMYRMQASVQKKLLKDKASIRLNMDDIFHSWKFRNTALSLQQATFTQVTESDTQRIGIAFTYSFGKSTFARKRKHTDNAADEEKGRTN